MNATASATQPEIVPETASQTASPGFQLPCPCCGEASANIDLHLVDMTFTCAECNNDFSAEEIRNLIARWTAVLAWIDTAPQLPTE